MERPRDPRIGATITREAYRDRRTGECRRYSTWTVKYQAFDNVPGTYRCVRERGFASYDEALAWWLERKLHPEREVPKAEVIGPPPLTLQEWLERWLKSVRKSIGAGALRQYESHVREHLIPSLGHRLLLELERDPQLIEDAMETWKRKDGRDGDLSAGFVKKIWCTLRTALNAAIKKKKITSNPCKGTDPPKVECKEMHALSPAQVKQYLAAFDKTTIGATIALALGSGCRCGELLALRWRNVDLEAGTIRVERSLERVAIRTAKRVRYELNFKEPKTRQSRRTIPVARFALERLRRHRIDQAQRFMAGGARPDADTLVFECDGLPWIPTSFGMLFARLRDAAELPKIRLHDLRHTYASLMIAAGVSLKIVSSALGHAKVGVTADTYAHVSPVMLRESVDRYDNLLERLG